MGGMETTLKQWEADTLVQSVELEHCMQETITILNDGTLNKNFLMEWKFRFPIQPWCLGGSEDTVFYSNFLK